MRMNLPNQITVARLLLSIAFLFLIARFDFAHRSEQLWMLDAAFVLFVVAAASDWLDGYLARRLRQVSPLGAFLDPVADKLIVATALVLIVSKDPRWFVTLTAAVIIGREIAISALREWMAQIGASRSVAVHMLGKVKTVMQMVAIPFLLFDGKLFRLIDTRLWGTVLIYIAAVLTIWSMVYYLQKALPEIRARAR